MKGKGVRTIVLSSSCLIFSAHADTASISENVERFSNASSSQIMLVAAAGGHLFGWQSSTDATTTADKAEVNAEAAGADEGKPEQAEGSQHAVETPAQETGEVVSAAPPTDSGGVSEHVSAEISAAEEPQEMAPEVAAGESVDSTTTQAESASTAEGEVVAATPPETEVAAEGMAEEVTELVDLGEESVDATDDDTATEPVAAREESQ